MPKTIIASTHTYLKGRPVRNAELREDERRPIDRGGCITVRSLQPADNQHVQAELSDGSTWYLFTPAWIGLDDA